MAQTAIQLERKTGQQPGLRYQITGTRVVIGRSTDADISLPESASISRQHSAIELDGAVVRVVDLGSQNGTLVNGVRVPSAELNDGDRLKIGLEEFVVHILSAEPGADVPTIRTDRAALGGVRSQSAAVAGADDTSDLRSADSGNGRSRVRRRGMGVLGGAVALIVCMLYLVSALSHGVQGMREPTFILRVHEDRVVVPARPMWRFDDIRVESMSGDGDEIATWMRYAEKEKAIGWLHSEDSMTYYDRVAVVFRGAREGEGTAVFLQGGKPVGTMSIIVRGVIPRVVDDKTDTDYARRADTLFREAKALKDGQNFEALRRVKLAKEYFEAANDATHATACYDLELELSKSLKSQVQKLYKEAVHYSLGSLATPANPAEAWVRFGQIQRLLPDGTNIDWQLAGILQHQLDSAARR